MTISQIKLQAAVEKAKRVVGECFSMNPETDEITIYLWDSRRVNKFHTFDSPVIGIRVSEVGYHRKTQKGMIGESYMQVDIPNGLLVCAATERYLIALYEDWPKDEADEEMWRLCAALCDYGETSDNAAVDRLYARLVNIT